jgi:N-acetylglutamate synthase-like GNAT family acetyltransferase
MNATLTIRPANPNDWRAVKSLLEENELPLDGAREHLDSYLLAIDNGPVVGCAGTELYGDIALLRSVAVAPLLQGGGIGKKLVSRLLEDAKHQQLSRIYLLTANAPEYFAKFGFEPVPIEDAPEVLKASAEFNGACPAGATLMSLPLTT